ncbi:type II secretion system F family protein [Persicobacter diffluens]|uniref:Type II secretion system protein GspF domain-containing protein n=1 Tax=Persicobacter diffluens TaxID=981 RepID=A0AAN4W3H4_9BACT|nr:hypothetical protein PEDI_55910 [Persicobacter diffluens]
MRFTLNQIEQFFNKLHKHYTDEIDMKTSTLNTVLEPLMIVFLGGIVGFKLITMYLPMFSLTSR